MKLSKAKVFNSEKLKANKQYSTAELLEHHGFIKQVSSGLFVQMYLMKAIMNNIEKIVKEELDKISCVEIALNQVQSADIWKQTGRYDTYGSEMFKLKDRNDKEMVFTGTNEELVTLVAKDCVTSYKDLGFTLYQINNKFRDEIRCNNGLIRSKEFLMMDAYSFHATKEDLEKQYAEMRECYKRILDRLLLNYKIEVADSGQIGGSVSEEFVVTTKDGDIEVGHIFQLDTKYSSKLGMTFRDNQDKENDVIMGCYGIGISRLAQVLAEMGRIDNCFNFSKEISAFDIHIIVADIRDEKQMSWADIVYEHYKKEGCRVCLDDRDIRVGEKLTVADNVGSHQKILIGKNVHQGYFESKFLSNSNWEKRNTVVQV